MMNPWLMLGFALVWIASMTGAYLKGGEHARNKAAAEYARQMDAALKQHEENTLIDMQAAAEVAANEARSRTRAAEVRTQFVEVIREISMPVACNWPDPAFGLLKSAIEAANDNAPAGKPVPKPMRKPDGSNVAGG